MWQDFLIFFFKLNNILLYVSVEFLYSSMHGLLGYFHIWLLLIMLQNTLIPRNREQNSGFQGWGKERSWEFLLMSIEFQFCKMRFKYWLHKKCEGTTLLNCTFKNAYGIPWWLTGFRNWYCQLLRLRFDPWPGNFAVPQEWPKKCLRL